ncbi:MAG: M28 family peptidase [Bacteroidetes bacterium]|nr:M28 family peptidase [Bacteroidota bacterium]MCL2302542.1 M28 family peptidase [Lentimicrobiaceae bacterium]
MKKIILLTFCFLAFCFVSFAGKFVLIPVSETNNLESLFDNKDLKIHYYNDDFVLATATEIVNFEDMAILDEKAFADVHSYAIIYCFNDQKDEYLAKISKSAKALYSGENLLIMKHLSDGFMPAKNDGMVMIWNVEAQLPKSVTNFPVVTEVDPFIQSLNEMVNTDTLMAYIQHLQDYETRVYFKPQAYESQNWMKAKFETWGLDVEVQNVSAAGNWWGTPATSSGNVIAIQTGTVYPNEYIVCGAHYDSFVFGNFDNAPGADDNATGTATVMEMARILSQYTSERSIIYCAFSAEEVGLFGSNQYATRCSQQGMNILGYFNIDMSGYLKPGTSMHIDLIHPSSANPLANYLKNINDIYFQIPLTSRPNLSGGDSDHTSFNQKGYMGIWTFEDWNDCSPHIHTTNDIIGPSVNNSQQVNAFTQINLASIAILAGVQGTLPPHLNPPTNCDAQYLQDNEISVTWDAPDSPEPDGYDIYRDGIKINVDLWTTTLYIDVADGYEEHCYKIKAVWDSQQSGFSNESCASPQPLAPPINCVATNFFEMQIKVTWDAPEENTPDGYYVYRDDIRIFEEPITTRDFFDIPDEAGEYCYTVTAAYGEFESEFSNESCAEAYNNITEYNSKFNIYPNPANDKIFIEGELVGKSVIILDVTGRIAASKAIDSNVVAIDISNLTQGVYFVKISNKIVRKFIKE